MGRRRRWCRGTACVSGCWMGGVTRLAMANCCLLAAAFATRIMSIGLAACRCSLIAGLHGVKLSRAAAVGLALAAQFFGQVLPSTIGANAVRSWLATRLDLPAFPVVASVIVDRLCGLVGLALLILVGLPRLLTLSGVGRTRGVEGKGGSVRVKLGG